MLDYINVYLNKLLTYKYYELELIFCAIFIIAFIFFIIKLHFDKAKEDGLSYVFDFKKFKEKKVPCINFYYPIYSYSQEKDIGFIAFFITETECKKHGIRISKEDGCVKILGLMKYLKNITTLNPLNYNDALQTDIYDVKPNRILDYYENNEEGSEVEVKYLTKNSRGIVSLESVNCFCPKNLANRLENFIDKQKLEFERLTKSA